MKNINIHFIVILVLVFIVDLISQPQNEYISDANTVLLLHLNETTGNTAYDASSYGNHGTINGNAPSEGKFFGGRQFSTNNTDLGIVLPNSSSLNITGPITIEAWIKADAYEMGGTFIIRHDEYQLCLGSFGSRGYLQFFRHVGSQWIIYQSDIQIPLNEWVHVAGVWDGSEAKVYINGSLQNITTAPNDYSPIGSPRVASHDGSILSPSTNTFVDEVRISDVARVTSTYDNISNPVVDFRLSQNYPNPFNPNTNIKFSIPNREFVTLKVFDVLGNEIATLIDEEKFSGDHSVTFNAKNLSSGVYMYRIQAGSFTETKKMTLIK